MPGNLKLRAGRRLVCVPCPQSLVALLCAAFLGLLLCCATRRSTNSFSAIDSSSDKFWLPPLFEKFGEKTGCETPQNSEFLKVDRSAAGGRSGLYDLCQEPQQEQNLNTISESSTAAERKTHLQGFALAKLVSVPGKTFIRDAQIVQTSIDAIGKKTSSAKISTPREIVLNIITRENKLREVDIWAGEDALAAAFKAGVSTIGELTPVLSDLKIDRQNFTILVNGKTSEAQETWPRWLESWNAPIAYDLKSPFPIRRKNSC